MIYLLFCNTVDPKPGNCNPHARCILLNLPVPVGNKYVVLVPGHLKLGYDFLCQSYIVKLLCRHFINLDLSYSRIE